MAVHSIAIDVMSGDFGPHILVPAALDFLQSHNDVAVHLVGNAERIKPLIQHASDLSRITVHHAEQVIGMDEQPVAALRNKKHSSLHLSIDLLKSQQVGACVSAGNTGALMAVSKLKLGMITGVDRPAICGVVPALSGYSYLLDMGANVDCNAQHLLQFARMASVMASLAKGIEAPTVALLNNGEEGGKGNSQVKQAAALFNAHPEVNYVGYVEGHKIFDALADIIVCDGFVGNVALKASEGVASYIFKKIQQEIRNDWLSKIFALFAWPILHRVKNSIDPRAFNGACLLGLQGVVIKSHGHADQQAFYYALERAYHLLKSDMIGRLNQTFLTH